MKRKHPERYTLLQAKRTQQGASTNANQTAMDLFVSVSTEIPKEKLFQIELSRDEIESAAIEAVTINGLPLSVFEKTGICKLLIPILDKLDITLNCASMKDRVLLQANQLRQQIAAGVEGKHICLKVDIASRNERGFLGINIQYIQEGCLRLRTLAVKELFERHTGNEIKRCILDVLESFRVNTIHVYLFTTDNASNMLKCGLLYEEIEAPNHELEGDHDEQDFLCETTIEANLVNATN